MQAIRSPAANKAKPAAAGMSKNRRERHKSDKADLEAQIAVIETDLLGIEESFKTPNAQTNWEEVHRRYDDLKKNLDDLYMQLNERWEGLGEIPT